MTKISEQVHWDENDKKMIVQETHDFTPVIDKAKAMKSAGLTGNSESRLVGLVPMKVWAEWAKKWGVSPSDGKAMREVLARELNDPDNADFRVWEGQF